MTVFNTVKNETTTTSYSQLQESTCSWMGRMISNALPACLSAPVLVVLQVFNDEFTPVEERICREIKNTLPNDVRGIIAEYSIPAEIEAAVSDWLKNTVAGEDEELSPSLKSALTIDPRFNRLVTHLDLSNIALAFEFSAVSTFRLSSRASSLNTVAPYFPNVKKLNLANCSLCLSSRFTLERILAVLIENFKNLEELNIKDNGLVVKMDANPDNADNTILISRLVELPQLRRLILLESEAESTKNGFKPNERAAAQIRYPYLEIINGRIDSC